jgi:hypothetical protein
MNQLVRASWGLLVALCAGGCLTDAWAPCPARGCSGRDAQVDTTGDRTPADVPQADDRPSAGDASLVLRRAGIGALGGRLGAGSLTLSGTSFDMGGRSCAGRMCLGGGITP